MIKELPSINSNYFICAAIKDSSVVKEKLINPIVAKFFAAHEITLYEEVPIEYCFSDIDYQGMTFDKIYGRLLCDARKNGGHVELPVKYILTIDKINCTQRCKKTEILFDTFEINDKPFLYFLYIDLVAMISTLRSSSD